MKKVLSVLMSFALFSGVFACTASAAQAPAAAEVLYPERVSLVFTYAFVPRSKIIVSDVGTAADNAYPGASKDKNLYAILKKTTTQEGSHVISRNIHTYDFATKSDIGPYETTSITGTRHKMKGEWDGTLLWKRPFTYEYDFTVNTLDNYYMLKIGNAGVKYVKDPTEEDKYYITWDGGGESDISGQQCEFGKTYHIRLEADMTAGQGVFAVFTDPETEAVNTSYKEHGMSYTEEQYATTSSKYSVVFECTGPVQITTDNEEMYYESYFIRSHKIKSEEDGSAVKAEATVLNSVGKARTAVPYLFLGVYDSCGAMIASTGSAEGTPAKQSSENGISKLDSAPFTYSVSINASELPDGEYTVKSFMWRDKDVSFVCNDSQEKQITVKDGVVTDIQ